jgi:DNA-binding CsgD family transcriptional regulator
MSAFEQLSPNNEHLLALHAAIEVEAFWKALNKLLREAIPCDRVSLFLGHIGMHEARKVFTDPPVNSPDREYFTKRAAANPFNQHIEANIGVNLYRFSDVLPKESDFKASPFYKEFAEPEGWEYGLSGLVWLGKDLRGMFSLYRAPGQSDFSEQDMSVLRELLPLISIAIDRVRRLHRERLYRAVLEDFNRNMPVGLLLLDWDLNIIYANTEASRLIATWNYGLEGSKQYNSREVFALPERLLGSCHSLRGKIIEEGDPGVRLLSKTPLPVDDCPEWLKCSVQAIRLNSANIAYPGFFVSIEHKDQQNTEPSPEINHEKLLLLNQLTPSERELALLVGEGLSNKEIAEKLSKSVLTVKKQLNSTFGKLNISNRARLIALLH